MKMALSMNIHLESMLNKLTSLSNYKPLCQTILVFKYLPSLKLKKSAFKTLLNSMTLTYILICKIILITSASSVVLKVRILNLSSLQ